MLLGVWKNIEDLEESINLDELEAVITAGREREMRNQKFLAALKGINLGEDEEEVMSPADRVEEMKRRVEARMNGMDIDDYNNILEHEELGIKVNKIEE